MIGGRAPSAPLRSFWMVTGAILALCMILPLLPLLIWSFAYGWRFPNLLPADLTLRAWSYALSNTSGVMDALWITTGIALTTTVLATLIGVPAGRALGQYTFRGKVMVEVIILAPLIVPGLAVGLGLHSVFIGLGLTGTVAGVVMVHLIPTLPYMTLIMAAVFANQNRDFEDQARSLGARPFAIFLHVTLPAILPGLLAGAAFTFLVSWSQYVLTLLIGSGKVVTLPLLLFSFATSGRNDIAGAIGIVYILPGILFLTLTAGRLTGRNVALPRVGRT
jgi:putative spermidine/putrescine transport system permease protein